MDSSRFTLPDLPGVAVTLRRSARARRFSLRVSRLDGQVVLTLPVRAPLAEAMAFAQGHGEWLRRTLAAMPALRRPGFGATLPVEGEERRIEAGAVRAPRLEPGRLIVPPGEDRLAMRLETFLRHCARLRLQAATERHAAVLGRSFRRITLRDTRSRWGSCAADGSLSYSWRLIMAPPAVLDYVAAHEVAHLAQMNHSPAFWAEVARLMPDYAPHRAWLKREGGALQAIRFRD
ncbi:M48 family metallopeptidase [Sinirhodobacter huangdaonensis]|uniref:M48 family peptidase n=1 Tax=Paenirhodobacter huangdaonensis TaxID=2501515 RepID=A0A443LVT5_9RHOB|nr:SprT family zinc-dependent metalloprotease [Sinirhodobacter huangdaonensis]RWR53307.1 M48 family peptidase [Sinirhodobacter huangdaonensis]